MSSKDRDEEKVEHYVNPTGFNPTDVESLTKAQERYYQAAQWKIIWWKFRKHKLAVVSAIILFFFYLCVPFAEMIAPYPVAKRNVDYLYAPPQVIHFFHEGKLVGPFVYGINPSVDLENLKWVHETDTSKVQMLRFFCRGEPYKFWGFIPASFHVICPAKGGTFFLAGTDRLGRDQYSGLIYGARLSLTIGLVGVSISMFLGVLLGGIAGFFGGWVDSSIQRVIEVMRSLPELPLWMALSAALPITWSPVWIYFGLTVILGLLDWPGLARAVRSKLLSLREEEYAKAAALMGANPSRIIFKHLLPKEKSPEIQSIPLHDPNGV